MFMYFLLPHSVCQPHDEAGRKPTNKGRITVWETTSYTSTGALPVQSLNNIVGSDVGPVFTGKVTVGQDFLNTALNSFYRPLQFHGKEFLQHSPSFSLAVLLLSWA